MIYQCIIRILRFQSDVVFSKPLSKCVFIFLIYIDNNEMIFYLFFILKFLFFAFLVLDTSTFGFMSMGARTGFGAREGA